MPDLKAVLLEALSDGPAYGTLLIRRVAAHTRGEVQLHSSRVYQALRSMAREGLIECCQAGETPENAIGRSPSYFRLTVLGWGAIRSSLRAS